MKVEAEEIGIKPRDYPKYKQVCSAIVQNLPFPNDCFDYSVSYATVPRYIPVADYAIALSELIRVTKPGGKVILSPCEDFELEYGVLDPNPPPIHYYDPYIVNYFNPELFQKALELASLPHEFHFYEIEAVDGDIERTLVIDIPEKFCPITYANLNKVYPITR